MGKADFQIFNLRKFLAIRYIVEVLWKRFQLSAAIIRPADKMQAKSTYIVRSIIRTKLAAMYVVEIASF